MGEKHRIIVIYVEYIKKEIDAALFCAVDWSLECLMKELKDLSSRARVWFALKDACVTLVGRTSATSLFPSSMKRDPAADVTVLSAVRAKARFKTDALRADAADGDLKATHLLWFTHPARLGAELILPT